MAGLLKDEGCKKLVLINAYYAGDAFMVSLMKNTLKGYEVEAYTPEDFVAKWNEGFFGDEEFCACIQKLDEVMYCFNGGVKIDTLDIILFVNMACTEPQIKGSVHLVPEQVEDVKKLLAAGVKVVNKKVGGKTPNDVAPTLG